MVVLQVRAHFYPIFISFRGWPPHTENAYDTIPSLWYNSIHQVYGENACHTFFIHFRNKWKLYDWHFFDGDTKIFPNNFEKLPQNFFCFFFNRKFNFVRKQTWKMWNPSEKKNFMQTLISCVHNVILDTLVLVFYSFHLNFFFRKRWKLTFLLYDVFMYALINVW